MHCPTDPFQNHILHPSLSLSLNPSPKSKTSSDMQIHYSMIHHSSSFSLRRTSTIASFSISDQELRSRGFTQHRTSTDLDLDALNTVFARVGFPRRDPLRIRRALDHSSSLLWLSHSKRGDCEPIAFARSAGDGVFNAVVWDVVVDPSFQGIGLGRAVMERIVADLRGMGVVNIALYAEPRVIGFYRPLGFTTDPDGITDNIHTASNGP